MKLYDIEVKSIDGGKTTLRKHEGKVLLIVNVASGCGFTPQYEGLEQLHRKFGARGLVVLGFPCNQFGAQEPGDEKEIQQFCKLQYDVTFPMFAKIEVNGPGTHPLYAHLKESARGILGTEAIKWNFTKFLVDRNGSSIQRFAPQATPASLEKDIEKLLG